MTFCMNIKSLYNAFTYKIIKLCFTYLIILRVLIERP